MSLFALPRELRDIVYDYALTEDNGLILKKRDLAPSDLSPPSFVALRHDYFRKEANQLKYVCRQLYHETKGRELRLNKVTAAYSRWPGRESQVENFELFLQTCSPFYRCKLLRVVLWQKVNLGELRNPYFDDTGLSLGEVHETISRSLVAQFCAQQPHCQVELRLWPFLAKTQACTWVAFGTLLQYMIHGTMPGLLSKNVEASIEGLYSRLDLLPIPRNLRIFPEALPADVDDTADLRATWHRNNKAQLCAQIRTLCENGF